MANNPEEATAPQEIEAGTIGHTRYALEQNIGKLLEAASSEALAAQDPGETPETEQPEQPDPEVPETQEDEAPVENQELIEESLTEAPDPEPDPEPEPEDGDTPEWFQKKIDKLTRFRREAEEEAKELKARLQKLEEAGEQPAQQPTETGASSLKTVAEVEQAAKLAQQRIDFVEAQEELLLDDPAQVARNLREAGVNLTDADGDEDYSETTMAKFLKRVKRTESAALNKDLPARKASIEKAALTREFAVKRYPYIGNPDSKWNAVHQDIANLPWLANVPEKDLFIARYLRGFQAELAGATKKPAKAVPSSAAKPKPKPQPSTDPLKEHRDRVAEEKTQQALSGFVSGLLQTQQG